MISSSKQAYLQTTVPFFGFEGVKSKSMPRKQAAQSKPRTVPLATSTGLANPPSAAPMKEQKTKAPAAGVQAPAARVKAPVQKVKTPGAKVKTLHAKAKTPRTRRGNAQEITPTNGRSILNLSLAVNGPVTAEQIAERAYFHWLERGCPFGSPEEDWLFAERELGLAR